jgi:hypothetical protein
VIKTREKRKRPYENRENEVVEGKTKKQVSFYAKESDFKSVFYINHPMFILVLKKNIF